MGKLDFDIVKIVKECWNPILLFIIDRDLFCFCGEEFDCKYNLDQHKEVRHPYLNPHELSSRFGK
jgi:hypothetical protein